MSEGGRAKKALCCGSLATSADAPLKRPASRAKPRLQLFPLLSAHARAGGIGRAHANSVQLGTAQAYLLDSAVALRGT